MNKILFLDDERNVLDGIKRLLARQKNKWDLSFFTDPLIAREAILKDSYDVVVSDIEMPALNGLDLLKEIKEQQKEKSPEFIIFTGLQDSKLKQKALDLDATDLLTKPIQKEDLIARLNNAIRLKTSRDEIISQNTALEQQLIQSQKLELIGLLASGVAHDFNNVLTVIMNYSQLLQQSAHNNEKLIKQAESILKASQHGAKIIAQILNFVKNKECVYGQIELNSLVQESLQLLKVSLPKTLEFKFTPNKNELFINGDYTQIFQIIMNLSINAARAMNSRGLITIELALRNFDEQAVENKHNTFVLLRVSDNGPGMEKEFIDYILSDITVIKRSKDGAGMGISIVKRIIANHKGSLQIESAPGTGTVFNIYLPAGLKQ